MTVGAALSFADFTAPTPQQSNECIPGATARSYCTSQAPVTCPMLEQTSFFPLYHALHIDILYRLDASPAPPPSPSPKRPAPRAPANPAIPVRICPAGKKQEPPQSAGPTAGPAGLRHGQADEH